jgi:hypothetical protein
MGRVVHGASCPWGELSVGRTVCLWGKQSLAIFLKTSDRYSDFKQSLVIFLKTSQRYLGSKQSLVIFLQTSERYLDVFL